MKLIRECYGIEAVDAEDLIVELLHGVNISEDEEMKVLIRRGTYNGLEEGSEITLRLSKILWGQKHCANCLKLRGPGEHFCNKTCAEDYATERKIELRF